MRPRLTLMPRPSYECGQTLVVRLRSQQCWRLLQALIEADEALDRDTLSQLLWPDAEPFRARQNLRQCLLYLRQGLPEHERWLIISAERISLNLTEIDLVEPGVEDLHDEDDEPLFLPRLSEMFARMDEDARRSAVIGLTPAWIAMGRHGEGLEEVDRLQRNKIGRTDPELLLSQAELCLASFRLDDAARVLEKIQPLLPSCSMNFMARVYAARTHLCARMYDNSTAIRQGLQAYRLAREAGEHASLIRTLAVMGHCYVELELITEARRAAELGFQLIKDRPHDPWKGTFYHLLTLIEVSDQRPVAARRACEKGIESLQTASQPGINGVTAARLGRLQEQMGDSQGALVLFEKAREALAETECLQEKAEVFTYLGDTQRRLGNAEKSLDNHERAVKLRRSLRTPDALGTSLRGAGMAAQLMGDHRTAIRLLSEAVLLFEGCGRIIGQASSEVAIARSYAATNRISEALPLFERGYDHLSREMTGMKSFQLPVDLASPDRLRREFFGLVEAGR